MCCCFFIEMHVKGFVLMERLLKGFFNGYFNGLTSLWERLLERLFFGGQVYLGLKAT